MKMKAKKIFASWWFITLIVIILVIIVVIVLKDVNKNNNNNAINPANSQPPWVNNGTPQAPQTPAQQPVKQPAPPAIDPSTGFPYADAVNPTNMNQLDPGTINAYTTNNGQIPAPAYINPDFPND